MKNFRMQLAGRIILLSATLFILSLLFVVHIPGLLLAAVVLGGVYQIISLIRYVDRTNRELKGFLESIQYSDFSHTFNFGSLGGSFKDLSDEFTLVVDHFKKLRNEREEILHYLETVVQHVGVGLIAFDASGNVELINRSAKRLLGLQGLTNVHLLDALSPNFGNYILQLPDHKKKVYRLSVKGETIQMLLYATSFRQRNQLYKLAAIQNILPELEEKEIEAYHKLIRVLTHEIMNSITPIASLASTVRSLLPAIGNDRGAAEQESMNDIAAAMAAIHQRSEGLIHFVDKYRSLTKIPKPSIKIFKAADMLSRLRIIMETAVDGKNIAYTSDVKPDDLELVTDPDLLEQVLINILNNAVQSVIGSGGGRIDVCASLDDLGRANIRVSDNGPGIPEELLEKIFIPFFTTRQDGSGIGLSLSQQIVRSLGGTISVASKPQAETRFIIRL